jgi:hypothetical protein
MSSHLNDEQLTHIAKCLWCKARMLDKVKNFMTPEQLELAGKRMKKALL